MDKVKELLKPRRKVIAEYFYSPYKVGDIIIIHDDRSVHLTTTTYRDEFGDNVEQANYFNPKIMDTYPHLFEHLEWWENRKPEEMPEYVKLNPENTVGGDEVMQVLNTEVFVDGIGLLIHKLAHEQKYTHAKYFLPATKEQYEQYLSTKQQKP